MLPFNPKVYTARFISGIIICSSGLTTLVASFIVLFAAGKYVTNPLAITVILSVVSALLLSGILIPFAASADKALKHYTVTVHNNDDTGKDNKPQAVLPVWLNGLLHSVLNKLNKYENTINNHKHTLREMQLREHICECERNELFEIIQSFKDAVIVTDSFNELKYANKSAAMMYGIDVHDSVHTPIDKVINDMKLVAQIKDVREGANCSTRRTVEHEINSLKNHGVYELSLGCLQSKNRDKPDGVLTILHDITKEKEISQMKSSLVAQASHELRTPLSSIKAYIELLLDDEAYNDESRKEFYSIISNETERLDNLIDNMLNISKIEAGLIKVEWTTLDLAEIVEEIVDFTRQQAMSKGIEIITKRGPQSYKVEADRDLIHQAITNLVSNAIKYTPGGGRVTVSTELTDCDRSVMIAVIDTGLGIPEEEIPKLFDKFYRIDSYTDVAKGTGLGLSLVKQIVECVHGGEINVESVQGMGSRFWFTVPCRR